MGWPPLYFSIPQIAAIVREGVESAYLIAIVALAELIPFVNFVFNTGSRYI